MATPSVKHMGFRQLRGDESNPTFGICVATPSHALHVLEADDAATDLDVAADSHPSVYIHSATTPATDYLEIYHDATHAYLNAASATDLVVQIDGTTEYGFNATELEVASGNYIQFLGNNGIVDSAGNEELLIVATGSAVNEITITNAATTASPTIGATGSGANIGLQLTGKGTGILQVGGTTSWTANGTSGVLITTMGPTAAGTNVKEWLTVLNSSGSTRYVPSWGA